MPSSPLDDQFFEPILGEQNTHFRKLKTVPLFSVQLLCSSLISLVGIILAVAWPPDKRCHAYFIMMYLRVAFWALTFIFDQVVHWMHDIHRLVGYHELHQSTKHVRGTPLHIVSVWSVFIMGVQTLMHQYYGDDFTKHCLADQLMGPASYVTIFSLLETLVLGCVHYSYISKVNSFNELMPVPDAMRESNVESRSVGFTQRGAGIAELLEKQADLIDYYKEQLNMTVQDIRAMHNEVVRIVQTSGPTTAASATSGPSSAVPQQ